MEENNNKPFYKKWWLWICIPALLLVLISFYQPERQEQPNSDISQAPISLQDDSSVAETRDEPLEEETPEPAEEVLEPEEEPAFLEPFETDLSAGRYVAGIDLPAGIYELTAVGGKGSVISANAYTYGINEMMSAAEEEYYIQEYPELLLDKGDFITVSSTLTIRMYSPEIDIGAVAGRENDDAAETMLGSGTYTAGVEFPAGTYHILWEDGQGNVVSSDSDEDGMNEIFGPETSENCIQQYSNAVLAADTQLTVSSCTVRLLPSR